MLMDSLISDLLTSAHPKAENSDPGNDSFLVIRPHSLTTLSKLSL